MLGRKPELQLLLLAAFSGAKGAGGVKNAEDGERGCRTKAFLDQHRVGMRRHPRLTPAPFTEAAAATAPKRPQDR